MMTKWQTLFLVALGILTVCVLCSFGYLMFGHDTETSMTRPAIQATRPRPMPTFPKIIYKLVVGHENDEYLGRMSLDVTMTTTGSNTEQFTTHNFPETDPAKPEERYREIEFEAHRGQFLYISAQESDGHHGWVRCEIYCDGKLVDSAASRGPFSIASCSGSAE